jgi:hypothetical protein
MLADKRPQGSAATWLPNIPDNRVEQIRVQLDGSVSDYVEEERPGVKRSDNIADQTEPALFYSDATDQHSKKTPIIATATSRKYIPR